MSIKLLIGKNSKYFIKITIMIIIIVYIVWTILTSGIFYYTYDIRNPRLQTIENRIGLKLPYGSTVSKTTSVHITNLYAKINIPKTSNDELLLSIKNSNRYNSHRSGLTFGKFTGWCNYDIKNMDYTYTEENFPLKGIGVRSIIIIMEPENDFRTVYIFNGKLRW